MFPHATSVARLRARHRGSRRGHVTAHVLGALPRMDAQSQGAGWLLEIERGPAGFGPGARAPVRLQVSALRGMLVPATALIYAEQGAYVYRQIKGDKIDTFATSRSQ